MNIKYYIVKNEMAASATDAKYLGRAVPNGVRNRAQMTANALKTEHFAEGTFNAVIEAAVAITQELCAEGHDVDWGPVRFLAKMHGSLPCEDSAFGDGSASLTLDADATNATRTTLGALEPVKVSAAEIASSIKVSNIMDVTTEQFGVVIGSTLFEVLGNGVTLDGDGEYVKAYARKTGELAGTATVVSVTKGQRAKCKFDPQLASGEYTLEIATKGLAQETTPRIFTKPVTAVYVEPTLWVDDVRRTTAGAAAKTIKFDEEFELAGRGFNENDQVYVKYVPQGSTTEAESYLASSMITSIAEGKIKVGTAFWSSEIASQMDASKGVKFHVEELDGQGGTAKTSNEVQVTVQLV